MTLRWRPFEQAVRQRVRAEPRASPALWREYKRVRKRPYPETGPWVFRALLTVAMGTVMVGAAGRGVSLAGQIGVVRCRCLGWSLYYAAVAARTFPILGRSRPRDSAARSDRAKLGR